MDGTGRHRRRAGLPPDLRIPESHGGIGHLRLQDISVLHLRASHYRPLGVRIPSVVRLPAPGIEYGCFRNACGGLQYFDGR